MTEPDLRPLALVTGASRGIGAAVARALAPGHDLLLGGRDPRRCRRSPTSCPGARPWPVEPHRLAARWPRPSAASTRLDVLVHSAGRRRCSAPSPTPPADTWRRQFEINVVAVAELTRLLLPALRAARGRVVLLNSGAGLNARPGWASYAASKFALRAFADALRAEEAAHGVRVTSMHPGRTDTEMQRDVVAPGGRARTARSATCGPSRSRAPCCSRRRRPDDAALTELVLRPAAGDRVHPRRRPRTDERSPDRRRRAR